MTLVGADRLEEALPIFEDVFTAEPRWLDLVGRLPASGLLPDDREVLDRITEAGP